MDLCKGSRFSFISTSSRWFYWNAGPRVFPTSSPNCHAGTIGRLFMLLVFFLIKKQMNCFQVERWNNSTRCQGLMFSFLIEAVLLFCTVVRGHRCLELRLSRKRLKRRQFAVQSYNRQYVIFASLE